MVKIDNKKCYGISSAVQFLNKRLQHFWNLQGTVLNIKVDNGIIRRCRHFKRKNAYYYESIIMWQNNKQYTE